MDSLEDDGSRSDIVPLAVSEDDSGDPTTPPSEPTGREVVGRPRSKKRKNFCPFCERLVTNISRHLRLKHADTEYVREYNALNSKSPNTRRLDRRRITNAMRHVGNDAYNREVISGLRTAGELIPVKHSPRGVSNVTHVSCKHCLGLYRKESVFRHLRVCGRSSDVGPADRISSGVRRKGILEKHAQLLVADNKQASDLLRTEVFPKMQKDERSVIAQSDALICRYGSDFRFTHRGAKQVRYCSSKMRTLAHLFLTMRQLRPDIKDFSDCIRPRHFNVLTEAVRKISRFDLTGGDTRAPSVPARLCSSLKRCANINKSEAIKSDTLTRSEKTEIVCEMNDFLHLMEKDWATEVGTNSENSRRRAKVVKEDVLPDPDDIRKFNEYVHSLCPAYVTELECSPGVRSYERLAKLIIAHIITFNRRRPNETVEITTEAYRSTLNKRLDYETGLRSGVSEEELRSGEDLAIFYVAANKNLRKVPVLLTRVFHKAMDALIAAHATLGIASKYIFARPGSEKLFDGSSVLREMANGAGLKDPSRFTANALRHHAATSSQLHAHDETYTKRLSVFMGHDLRTHEHYYEMPLPLVQKSIVGHRLLQMVRPVVPTTTCTVTSATIAGEPSTSTAGFRSRHRGDGSGGCDTSQSLGRDKNRGSRTLDDDEHSSFDPPAVDVEPITTNRDSDPRPQPTEETPDRSTSEAGVTVQETVDPTFVTPPRAGRGRGGSGGGITADSESSSPADSESGSPVAAVPKKVHPKRKWSEAEKNAVYERFGQQFIFRSNPTRAEIKAFWENEPVLKGRTLPQVASYVNNIVTGKHHMPTPTRRRMKRKLKEAACEKDDGGVQPSGECGRT